MSAMRGWVVVVALAGCDKLLSLGDIHPQQFVKPGLTTIAAGRGHTCWIRSDGALFCWGDNEWGQLGIGSQLVEDDTIIQVGTDTWASISASHDSTCGIEQTGSLFCWGENANGQLGTGDGINHQSPAQIAGKWRSVSVNPTHSCAIDDNGALWCWGDNSSGELGDGTTSDQPDPEQIDVGYLEVSAGDFYTCAIRGDHALACWGTNVNGQLGDGTQTAHMTPTVVGSDRWTQVVAGQYHTCGVTASGHASCWGAAFSGQLGNGGGSDQPLPGDVLVGGGNPSDWVGITATRLHSCAWNASAGYCWGDSSRGELGNDGAAIVGMPVAIAGGPWLAIATGEHHTCAVDGADGVWCMGSNAWGQLGTGSNSSQPVPELVASGTGSVYAGLTATCVIGPRTGTPPITVGTLACGGDNYAGNLGVNDRTSRSTLAATLATTWYLAAPGDYHTCALDYQQHLFCWGDNGDGNVGVGSMSAVFLTPQQVSSARFNKLVARDHTCALDVNGGLACWGNNDRGQVGVPSTTMKALAPGAPIVAPSGGKWIDVAVGEGFTCAIDDTTNSAHGGVYCWGWNNNGQLGNGSMNNTETPTLTSPALDVTRVYAGVLHACAVDGSGNAWCWGYNGSGETGSGSGEKQPQPAAVTGTWLELSLGYYHTCGVTPFLTLECWGDNRRGQLGTGDTTRASKASPQTIDTSAWSGSVMHVSANGDHTCAITSSQDVRCWGDNDDGALLDGKAWTAALVQVPTP
jgi:alpha-tubulin suppressor-like RCC1 family protein